MLGQQFPSLVENVSSLDLANLGINPEHVAERARALLAEVEA